MWYVVEGDVVVIASRHVLAAKYRSVRVYPIGFAFADLDPESREAEESAEKVRDQIQVMAGVGAWFEQGGTGFARVQRQYLVVDQADEVQGEVAAIINKLREEYLARIRRYDVGDLVSEGGVSSTAKADQLATVLRATCGRGTWRGAGGGSSSLAFFGRTLCVNAPAAVHEQIEHELALLRR